MSLIGYNSNNKIANLDALKEKVDFAGLNQALNIYDNLNEEVLFTEMLRMHRYN